MSESEEETQKKSKIQSIFGDDSEDEDDVDFKPSSSAGTKKTITADASGLFGSDSESEEDGESDSDEDFDIKKKSGGRLGKRGAPSVKKKAPAPKKKKTSEIIKTRKRKESADAGDEYDSGAEVKRSRADDDFIDGDDDMAHILGEYDEDNQVFEDERPFGSDDDEMDDEDRNKRNKKIRKSENFFDETLQSIKSGRRRNKIDLTPQELEQLVQEFLYRLDKAFTDDEASIKDKKPAFEKIKFVDKAVNFMSKLQIQPTLLDFDLLGILKKWIQPNEDGTLPNLGIRTKILKAIKRLPIYKDHLKRSGLGKVVMTLWKHPIETIENKEICRFLIDRWSRSVFEKTTDYRKLAEIEAERIERGEITNRIPAIQDENEKKRIAYASHRVTIPQGINIDFINRPVPKIDINSRRSTKLNPESSKGKLNRKMQNISRPAKKSTRAVKLSIEGRGTE